MKPKYSWIRNEKEYRFAEAYIRKHASDSARKSILASASAIGRASGPQAWVKAALDSLEGTADQNLITRLNNNLRQHRSRHTAPGRKQRSFTLPETTCKALAKSARQYNTSQAEIINMLVTESSTARNAAEQKHKEAVGKLKAQLANERLRRKQEAAMKELQVAELKQALLTQIKHLEMWEEAMGASIPPFDGDLARLEERSEKRFSAVIKEADLRAKVGAFLVLRESTD